MDESPYTLDNLPTIPDYYITDWAGDGNNLPDGWALCDGTNGTPDMRDRFTVAMNPQEGCLRRVWVFIMKLPEE